MPGWIRVGFSSEPSFADALAVQGSSTQVLVHEHAGRILGMGCRSLRRVHVNGVPCEVGYLGGLRIAPSARRGVLLGRGYAALHKLDADHPVPFHLTTIVEGNEAAKHLLTSRRAGLPHYLDQGRFITYAIPLTRRMPHAKPRAPVQRIVRGDEIGLRRLLAFYDEVGARRQFFPVLNAEDFGTQRMRGLNVQDFHIALDADDQIIAAAAVWNQMAFKQTVVRGYAPMVGWLRPGFNWALRLCGWPELPAAGQPLKALHVAFACSRLEGAEPMASLLGSLRALHAGGSATFLLFGLHERDPLGKALVGLHALRYTSRLYLVAWPDSLAEIDRLDAARIPHLETATL